MNEDTRSTPIYPRRPQVPFDVFVDAWQGDPRALDQWSQWLQLLLFVSGSRNILEVGTGCGYLTAIMAQEVKDLGGWVLTIGQHADSQIAAEQRWQTLQVDTAIQSAVGNPQDLLLDRLPDSFDCIIYNGDNCPGPDTLASCLRLLRIGGLFAVLTQERDSGASASRWLGGNQPLVDHLIEHSALEVLQLPGSAGLVVARKPEPIGGALSHEYLD